jgi:hypothetical protein
MKIPAKVRHLQHPRDQSYGHHQLGSRSASPRSCTDDRAGHRRLIHGIEGALIGMVGRRPLMQRERDADRDSSTAAGKGTRTPEEHEHPPTARVRPPRPSRCPRLESHECQAPPTHRRRPPNATHSTIYKDNTDRHASLAAHAQNSPRAQRHELLFRLPAGRCERCQNAKRQSELNIESMALQDGRAVAPGESECNFCGWVHTGILNVTPDGVLVEVPASQRRGRGAV